MTEGGGESPRKNPAPGRSYGPYQIIDKLGSGGMGEVYRARDSKLTRDVALKFLPEELASDAQLLARFEREAKLLALVNHPNIATIHSIEEEGGHPYLVLELVEGDNLSTKLKNGPLEIRDALRVCRDIAAALEAAHAKGIVHRDLKPANVVVTPEGIVKVLDFGIAKPVQFGQAAHDLGPDTPSEELTATGVLVGTGPYMSPEQIRGREAGTRVDVWAFGCLMYQVLTAEVAFGRETLADTLTSILEREPDWSRLPAKTPEPIERLLKRCLRKDPSQRLQAIGDARIEIEEAIRQPSGDRDEATIGSTIPTRRWVAGAAAMLAVGIAVGVVASGFLTPPEPFPSRFYDFTFPEDVVLGLGGAPSVAVSRDGTRFVVAFRDGLTQHLRRRDLDSPAGWTAITGTEGAESPFFSWDGERVGFFAAGELRWAPYDGSAQPEVLADAVASRGGAWSRDGTIYYSANQELWETDIDRAPRPVPFADASGNVDRRWPLILPDGETLLYTVWDGAESNETGLYMWSSTTGEELVVANAGYARYTPSEHLVFVRGDQLYAIGFDPNALRRTEDPFALNERVVVRAEIGVPLFDIAQQSGTFVGVSGPVLTPGPVLAWMDARNRSTPRPLAIDDLRGGIVYPRLSPDGRTLVVTIEGGGGAEESAGETFAATIDIATRVLDPVVSGVTTYAPEWNPAGDALAFLLPESFAVFSKAIRTTGYGQPLTEPALSLTLPTAWIDDRVLYNVAAVDDAGNLTSDVWYVDVTTGREVAFLDTDYLEYGAVTSRDGELVAYTRREVGEEASQVRVTTLSKDYDIGVSTGRDCQEPTWSGDGRQLFFRCGSQMVAVELRETSDGFIEQGNREILFDWPFALDAQSAKASYAYDAERERFLMVSDDPIVTAISLDIGQNWHELLLARASR